MKLQAIKQMPSNYGTSQACRYLSLVFDTPMELASAMYKSTLTRRIIVLISISLLTASYLIFHRSENILETALLGQTKQQAQVFLLGLESQLQA